MEIKIFETEKTLKIEKHCKKEQFISRILLLITYAYMIYIAYKTDNINIFIIMPIIMIYVAYRIITLKYMYEIIYINEENIYFNTGYNQKILKNISPEIFKNDKTRPDVVIEYKDETFKLIEVKSKTDTERKLINKLKNIQNKYGEDIIIDYNVEKPKGGK
ncbi:hypothetical protein [Fusobacterium nucleatum]|uniref:hypothetical protein n=1 Tax=Fusobacterium nucleatum TaxID=851 RepID=UPI0030D29C4F